MKILFSMRHAGALRNFASTIGELANRGHDIHLAFMVQDKIEDDRLLRELTTNNPSITFQQPGGKTPWHFWLALARRVRAAADYVRYCTPEYKGAHALRERAARRVSAAFRAVLRLPLVRTRRGLRLATGLFHTIERAIPPDPAVADLIAARKPDVVLVTPLVDLGSDQVEYLKAARALGVRSGFCVHSWDNLTNKGLIHVLPDRVFVWNDAQKREAVAMHAVRPAQVVVTGAPVFDLWFDRRPSTTREEFCRKVGLPAEKPFFLYLCSSQFVAPHEADFVSTWIRAVRSAPDPRVRDAGILVRPHPRTSERQMERLGLAAFTNVVIWPRGSSNPVDTSSKNDYFDSMYHAAGAVGVSTSAQIEAGIVGRPVYSIRVPKYALTQEGTLHFHYLLNEGGGLLHMADTLDEHVRSLSIALEPTAQESHRLRSFVNAFVRPHGLGVPATPLLADAIEELGRLPKPAPAPLPPWLYAVRLACYPVGTGMKLARYFARRAEKRKRQLRPITVRHI